MENNNGDRSVGVSVSPQRRRKIPKWKRFFLRYGFLIVSVAVLAAVIVGIVLICRGCLKTTDVSDFDGTYYVDDYTAYEFDGKGKGALCLGETTRYIFCYTVNESTVSLDFEDERINDAAYTFARNGDSITLTETNGLNVYTMKKK